MEEKEKRRVQEKHLEILAINGGFEFTNTFFPYTSGEIGPYYVQSAVVMQNGKDYKEAVADMRRSIELETSGGADVDVISGGETRDWIFSFPIATQMGLAPAMLYKNGKYFGPNLQNKNVVHVADLSNEGSSPRDLWVPAIRNRGGKINQIFFYVDRMEQGPIVMKELGLESHALVPLDQNAWDYLREINAVSQTEYTNLRERGTSREERETWAINMLRSEVGKERLRELYNDPKQQEKAEKVILHYTNLSEELREAVN